MCVYVHAKYEVSSIILTSFRQGVGDGNSPIPPRPPTSKRTPEKIRVKGTVDRIYKCCLETETIFYFFLCCRLYCTMGRELLDDIYIVAWSHAIYPDEKFLNILLYGSRYFSVKTNQSILKSVIKFLRRSGSIDGPFFYKTKNKNIKLLL